MVGGGGTLLARRASYPLNGEPRKRRSPRGREGGGLRPRDDLRGHRWLIHVLVHVEAWPRLGGWTERLRTGEKGPGGSAERWQGGGGGQGAGLRGQATAEGSTQAANALALFW